MIRVKENKVHFKIAVCGSVPECAVRESAGERGRVQESVGGCGSVWELAGVWECGGELRSVP